MYAPQHEIREEVEAARERIKKLVAIHSPPQTDDETLVCAYEAMTAGGPEN